MITVSEYIEKLKQLPAESVCVGLRENGVYYFEQTGPVPVTLCVVKIRGNDCWVDIENGDCETEPFKAVCL